MGGVSVPARVWDERTTVGTLRRCPEQDGEMPVPGRGSLRAHAGMRMIVGARWNVGPVRTAPRYPRQEDERPVQGRGRPRGHAGVRTTVLTPRAQVEAGGVSVPIGTCAGTRSDAARGQAGRSRPRGRATEARALLCEGENDRSDPQTTGLGRGAAARRKPARCCVGVRTTFLTPPTQVEVDSASVPP